MEYLDKELRDAYFNPPKGKTRAEAANLMWYLWLGPDSPLFGKDKMTTFERFVHCGQSDPQKSMLYRTIA